MVRNIMNELSTIMHKNANYILIWKNNESSRDPNVINPIHYLDFKNTQEIKIFI